MAKDLDEIIKLALDSDQGVQTAIEGRLFSTCVEVPPMQDDNTPVPYLIITDDPYKNDQSTKDNVWEGNTDKVQASVIISANSPEEVRALRRKVRKAIRDYVVANGTGDLYLVSSSNEGIAWDWTKPCYYDILHYTCEIDVNLTSEDDE